MTRVTFFQKRKLFLCKFNDGRAIFFIGVCSPLDGVIGRRESSAELGERSDKLQRGASGKKKNSKKMRSLRLDKFAWTSTVLNSRREIDRLLGANNSIETDGEGKFVSFKVVRGSTSLFKMNHGPAGLDSMIASCVASILEHWSS